jgi:hypothetical protein
VGYAVASTAFVLFCFVLSCLALLVTAQSFCSALLAHHFGGLCSRLDRFCFVWLCFALLVTARSFCFALLAHHFGGLCSRLVRFCFAWLGFVFVWPCFARHSSIVLFCVASPPFWWAMQSPRPLLFCFVLFGFARHSSIVLLLAHHFGGLCSSLDRFCFVSLGFCFALLCFFFSFALFVSPPFWWTMQSSRPLFILFCSSRGSHLGSMLQLLPFGELSASTSNIRFELDDLIGKQFLLFFWNVARYVSIIPFVFLECG